MDTAGTYEFYNTGLEDGADAAETAFFIPPYYEIVKMNWSTGNAANEEETEEIEKIDLRAQYLSFDFEVRTNDNVRLRLQGTIFWRVAQPF